MGNILNLV